VTVSDAEVDAAFLERYPDGAVERRYDIHQILLIPPHGASPEQLEEVRQQLEALRQRALRGESFEELARTYSQDASRRRDGHMGSYRQGQLPRAFEERIFNLMEGEISEVFQTRFGFHVIRLNRLWDEPTVDIDAVREEIYRELQLAKQNREIERYMVQLHEDNIIQLQFDPSSLF
jgi:parvulin-like peptidyl-prolyl isomerase